MRRRGVTGIRQPATVRLRAFAGAGPGGGGGTLAATLSRAAHFTAAGNQTLTLPSNATLQVGTGSFTVCGWVKLASKTTYRPLVEKRLANNSGALEYLLRYDLAGDFGNADRFEFVCYNGSAYTAAVADALGSPSTGVWYFVVGWFDGSSVNVQVNNGAVNSAASTGSANNTYPFFVGGAVNGASGLGMDGAMGPSALFKRALTPTERTVLYNGGVPLAYADLPTALKNESASTFVSYWNLDEAGLRLDQRSTANHLSALGNTGTAAGTVVRAADAADVIVGQTLTLSLSTPAGMTSPTWACDQPAFSLAGNVATYVPIFEDGGAVRTPTFSATENSVTATKQVTVYTFPDFSSWANDSGNPLLSDYYAGGTGQQDSMWFGGLDDDGTKVTGLGSVNTSLANSNDDLGQFSATKASLLRTWTADAGNPVVVRGGAGAWDEVELLHPTKTLGPATGGPLSGKYLRYYGAGNTVSPGYWVAGRQLGILHSTDRVTWTKWAGNPWYAGGDMPGACQDATTIHLYAATVNGIDHFTVALADPTAAPAFAGTLVARSSALAGSADVLDPEVARSGSGVEFAYTTTENQQSLRYALSADGDTFLHYHSPVLSRDTTQPGTWAIDNVGDAVLARIENWQYLFYAALVTGGGVAAGLFKKQSPTTGHFLTVATTTYADGATAYAASPNGRGAANMTAVPASSTVTVTASAYAAGGVTLAVAATNGVSVAFTLNGMTASHQYTVTKNGVGIATPTANGSGVLTFSNSAWGASDAVAVAA